MSVLNHITATGDVGSQNGGAIDSVILTPAAATAALTLRKGGSSGTIILVLQAAANGQSVQAEFCGAEYEGQLHATLSGAGATANVELI